jgi:hypothetical protein
MASGQILTLAYSIQSKQTHIDELLVKLDNASGGLERLREEKDAEIQILSEGMDTTIQQLSEAQAVCCLAVRI